MKSLTIPIVSVLSIAIGVAVGVGTSLREFANERGVEAVPGDSAASSAGGGPMSTHNMRPGQPRVIVLGEADFDFGVMERNETMSHTFQLKNVGDAPSTLTQGETTCKCTLSELDKGKIAPGETVDVTLQWKPNSFADLFRQSAKIETDDPDNSVLTLEVHGRVIQTVRPIPEDVVLSNISANEPRTAEVFVYCYRDVDFSLQFDRAQHEATKDFYEVEIVPLTEADIDDEALARAGVKVLITVKPGLPLGPIHQSLVFTSNVKELPELTIPVRGTMAGDISVLASKSLYDSDNRLITLGGVPRGEGGTYRLQVLVKGPNPQDIQLSVGEVDPADVLHVELATESPSRINDGAVLLYPLTITVPPGARPVSYLGQKTGGSPKFGTIVIETTHPQAKQILLHVKFAVEG